MSPARLQVVATFCLIHGAWHDASCWDALARRLRAAGHEVLTPNLPFDDPESSWEQRAQPAIQALDDVDGPVVIVGHSMASAYAVQVAAARSGTLLVYLCPRMGGFEPPAGAPEVFRAGFPFPSAHADGTSSWEPDAAIAAMYSRLAPEIQAELVAHLQPMALPSDPYPLDTHPDNPVALIYAAEDEFFQPDWERFMALEFLGIEPIEIPGGHFPMAEDPDGLAALLGRLAVEHAG